MDGKTLEPFKALAGEIGLDSEKAQKIFDYYLKTRGESMKAAQETWAKTKMGWREATTKDPDLAGDGRPETFKANIQMAIRGVDFAGGAELRDVLERTGLGSHPTVVKAFYRIGKALSEDSLAGSAGNGTPHRQDRPAMASLFTSMQQGR